MKLTDKLWLASNKRQPGKWSYYSTIFFAGVATVFFAILGVSFVRSSSPWIGWLILLFTLVLVIGGVVIDNKKGYVEALHKRQIELWEEKRKKLGAK